MGEQVQREVQSTFTAVDKSTSVLGKIRGATDGVASSVDRASAGLAGFAGLAAAGAGAFGLASAVRGTMDHLGNVKRIVNLTGMAAERADGLTESMAKVGISGEEAARYMLLVSKAGAKMEMALAGGSAQAQTLTGWLKQMGVDVKHGPESTFMGLASAMKKGKLELTDLMLRFRIPMSAAADMAKFLKQGPEAIRNTIEEMQRSGMAVSAGDLATYGQIKSTTRDIKLTWDRINIVVAKELLPVVRDLLQDGADKLHAWLPRAKAFGNAMGGFLRDHLHLVTMIGKALLTNAMLVKVTGTGMIGNVMRAGSWVRGSGPLVKARVMPDLGIMNGILGGRGMTRRSVFDGGGIADLGFNVAVTQPSRLQRLQSTFAGIYSGAGRLTPVLAAMGRVAMLSAGMLLAAGAFQGITEALEGKGTYAASKWRETFGYLSSMGIEADNIFGPEGTFMAGLANISAWLANVAAKYSSKASTGLATRYLAAEQLGSVTTWKGFTRRLAAGLTFGHTDAYQQALKDQQQVAEGIERSDLQALQLRQAKRAAAAAKDTPEARARNYVDMRYSKFEITNKFAEGYDADRIAVGFVNKLASMGERRLQSGFAPLFTVR